MAPLRALHRCDRGGSDRRLPHPDRLRPGSRRGGSHGNARPCEGLLRLLERDHSPHRHRFPRGPGGREVRPGRAARKPRGRLLRAVDTRSRLQRLSRRWRYRPRLPQQHRPLRRPLPARALDRRGGRGEAGRREPETPRKLPHVLGHGEPHAFVGSLVHRDGGKSPRGGDRPRLRSHDRIRFVARRFVGSDARGDGATCRSFSTKSSLRR